MNTNTQHISLCDTKENHYVPQFYLKSFFNPSNTIFYYDKLSPKIYSTTTLQKIAVKKNLYAIQDKISPADVQYFCDLFQINPLPPLARQLLSCLICFLNDELKKLFSIQGKNDKKLEEQLNNLLEHRLNTPNLSRNQELLFSFYEEQFQPIYHQIIKTENAAFLQVQEKAPTSYLAYKIMHRIFSYLGKKVAIVAKDYPQATPLPAYTFENTFFNDKHLNCLHYIITQYFRIPLRLSSFSISQSHQDTITKRFGAPITEKNIMFLMLHFQSLNVIDKLVSNNYRFILIKNQSKKAFITSDNPAINPFNRISSAKEPPEGFEIFFPLSPNLALLYTKYCLDKNFSPQTATITLKDASQVVYWNQLLFKEAERYVYANSKETLQEVISTNSSYCIRKL